MNLKIELLSSKNPLTTRLTRQPTRSAIRLALGLAAGLMLVSLFVIGYFYFYPISLTGETAKMMLEMQVIQFHIMLNLKK